MRALLAIVRLACVALVIGVGSPGVSAQSGFEVASIKENTSASAGGSLRFMPGGGVRAQHMPAMTFITVAYGLQRFQVVGAPDWVLSRYYDVFARPGGTATREQTIAMLQPLLLDRFQLKFHRENRAVDGYVLVRSRADRLGPALHPSSVDCSGAFTEPRCREGEWTLTSGHVIGSPMWSLVQMLVGQVSAPVSDETQLAGTYDYDLRWSNDLAPTDDARSIFTAVREQLGLKLERRKVTAEVFVVDRIERPTPD